jgi:beta-phosphoglucomutase-like phosphatase (HAD superfamily)
MSALDRTPLPALFNPIPLGAAGTVLDTMGHHAQAWKQLSEEFKFHMTVDMLLALAGKPTRAILELLCEQQVGRGRCCWGRGSPGRQAFSGRATFTEGEPAATERPLL